jgi:lysozyme
MITSDQGVALIREREGCRLVPYQDSVGVWTDGVGNTIDVVPHGPAITQAKADADLRRNLGGAEAAVSDGLEDMIARGQLAPHQFDALVSFTFNVGGAAFAASTLLRLLKAGDAPGAAAQFDRWHIPPEIAPRRTGEREQFKGTRFAARLEDNEGDDNG